MDSQLEVLMNQKLTTITQEQRTPQVPDMVSLKIREKQRYIGEPKETL
jgi:hypothetical protein